MKHILAATDGSQGAARGVAAAAELARLAGATLSIITVGNEGIDGDLRPLARAEGGVGAALDLLMERTLLEARGTAGRHGIPHVQTHTGWGDAAEVILETAARIESDLIVVGRRGRGRLSGLLLGSVSQKIVTLAPCAVLVIP